MTLQQFYETLSVGKWQVRFTQTLGLDEPCKIVSVNYGPILVIVLEDTDLFLTDDLFRTETQQISKVSEECIEVMYRLTKSIPPEKLIFTKVNE